jgi:ATP-dependent helicase/nuclease subunit B
MDYKTGSSPTAKTLQSGAAPQLPLEAMMAEAGAFGPEFTGPVTEMAIWKLSGGRIEGDDTALVQDATQLRLLINLAATNLPALLIKFFNPDVPYLARPHPDRVLRQDIFDGISRRAEWLDENQADEYAI